MNRKIIYRLLNFWLVWLVCVSVLADPRFFVFNPSKKNQNHIHYKNFNPSAANIGQFSCLDGNINQTYEFSQKTGEILTIPITDTQAIEKIEFSLDQINCTNQIINNSIMEKLEETGTSNWGVNSSLGIQDGLSAILDNSTFLDESVLQFNIKGNEGTLGFSPFSHPLYNESFYNLDNWNQTSNGTAPNYEIDLTSTLFVAPFDSKTLKSEASVPFSNPKTLYRGKINQSFFYDGTNKISGAKLGFNYQLSYLTNTSITLSVWFMQPNGSLIKFNNWETTQKGSILRQEFNDPADFEAIFQEVGLYYIIFQFDHFFNASSGLSTTTLLLDEINFQMNFTARDISPNEILYFSQNMTHPFTALEDGLLNYNFSLATFPSYLDPNDWAFSILLAEMTFDFGTLTAYTANIWNSSQISLPKSLLSNRSFELMFRYQYLGSSPLRFNSSMSWGVIFNEIELWINSGYGWAGSRLYLNTTFNAMVGSLWVYTPGTSDPLDPTGTFLITRSGIPWLSDNLPKIQFLTEESGLNLSIIGEFKIVSISWRDYVLSRVFSVYSELDGYIDHINGWIFSPDIEWGVLTSIIPLLDYIGNQDYRSLLYYGYQSHPSLGRLFASYVAFIDRYYSYSALNFTRILSPLANLAFTEDIQSNTLAIQNVLSPLLLSQKVKIAENYVIFRNYLNTLAIESPPSALKLPAFAQQMFLIDNRLNYISQGNAGWLITSGDNIFYPAFDFRLQQTLNLQTKWSGSLNTLVSTCAVQFLESRTFDSENHIIPAIPIAFFKPDQPTLEISSSFSVKVQNLKVHDYFLLTLFDLLYTAFQATENTVELGLTIQNALGSTVWNDPNYFASDTNFTADFNNFKPHSKNVFMDIDLAPEPEGDDAIFSIGSSQILQVNGAFAEIVIQAEDIPTGLSNILETNPITTEIQIFVPNSFSGSLEFLTGYLFENELGSSIHIPVPDCLLLNTLFRSDTFLRSGQFSLVLNIVYRIGNYVLGANWTEIVAFSLTDLALRTSNVAFQQAVTNYFGFSHSAAFPLHRCDLAWVPVIPNVGVVNIEWVRGEQAETFANIPLGEISGNHEFFVVSVDRINQNETINSILADILLPKALLGQFGSITYHFMSLNRLKSLNNILIIHEVLRITLHDKDEQQIEIEIPLEYRIFPPLTLDAPINSWIIYLVAILIIGFITLIYIYRLRQRFYLGDLEE